MIGVVLNNAVPVNTLTDIEMVGHVDDESITDIAFDEGTGELVVDDGHTAKEAIGLARGVRHLKLIEPLTGGRRSKSSKAGSEGGRRG